MDDSIQQHQDNINRRGPHDSQGPLILTDASFSSDVMEEARAAAVVHNDISPGKVRWRNVNDHHVSTNDRLIISIAVGAQAQELIQRTGPTMEDYAKKCGAQFTVLTGQTQTWWGLEKFRIAPIARKHHQTLFLDADVFIRRNAPNIFDRMPAEHVAMSVELKELEVMQLRERVTDWSRYMHESQGEVARKFKGFNSGVVLCDSTTAQVWNPPTNEFAPFHTSEQAWLERNVSAFNLPFRRLPWRFNCQHWWPNFNELVGKGHFVHLSGAPHQKRLVLCQELAAGKI